jgi:hypothetical protein
VAEARSDTGNDGGAVLPTVVAASRVLLEFRSLGGFVIGAEAGKGGEVVWRGSIGAASAIGGERTLGRSQRGGAIGGAEVEEELRAAEPGEHLQGRRRR